MAKIDPPKSVEEDHDMHEVEVGRRSSGASKRPRLSNDSRMDEDIEKEDRVTWVQKTFGPVKEQLYFVMAHNLSLKDYLTGLFKSIAAGGG
jgi:chromatin structure-remodeling complex subunit RSC9